MKKKFESNVATEIPKTKLHEPSLPWKLSEDEVGQIGPKEGDYRAVIAGTPPLRTEDVVAKPVLMLRCGVASWVTSTMWLPVMAVEPAATLSAEGWLLVGARLLKLLWFLRSANAVFNASSTYLMAE